MKEIAVFGLGKFGQSIAQAYTREGGNVLAIDNDSEKIQEISDMVTYAVKADVTDVEVMRTIGLGNIDVAIIAIAENFEAAVMATILCKEAGVKRIVAKAQNETYANVLSRVGADRIIYPEKEMGIKVARNIARKNILDIADISDSFSIVEVKVPLEWIGKTLIELNIRKKYGFNIIAIRLNNVVDPDVNPNEPLDAEMSLIVMGKNTELAKVF